MTDAIKEMVHQGDWLGLAAALAFASVKPMPPVAILPDPPLTASCHRVGNFTLYERVVAVEMERRRIDRLPDLPLAEQLQLEEEAAAEEGRLIEASGYQFPEYERNGR